MLVDLIVHVKVNIPYTSGSYGINWLYNNNSIARNKENKQRSFFPIFFGEVGLGFWIWLKAKHFGTNVDAPASRFGFYIFFQY